MICAKFTDVFQNGLPLIKWNEFVDDDIERGATQVSQVCYE